MVENHGFLVKTKKILKRILEEDLKTAKQVRQFIIDEFNVEYSIRQVERILNALGFSYSKTCKIYEKMPEDAEEILKKN